MNDDPRTPPADADVFADLAHTPRQHFTLYIYAALLRLLAQASAHFGSAAAAVDALPFLAGYFGEIAGRGLEGASFHDAHARWRDAIDAWERAAPCRLPLAVLRESAGFGHDELTLLAQIGLPEEDPRLGLVFDSLQGGAGERRATPGLLASSWQIDDALDARSAAHRLQSVGVIESVPGEAMGLRPVPMVWDAVRGAPMVADTGWARHRALETLPELETLVLPTAVRAACAAVPPALRSGAASVVVLRGPRHNGRSTLAGALAREIGKSLLHVSLDDARDARWGSAAALACLLDAAIVMTVDPGPSETRELPDVSEGMAPLFVTLGTAGGLSGARADRAITLRLPVPDHAARTCLWERALGAGATGLAGQRLTSGNIVRAAKVARAASAVAGATALDTSSLRAAVRTLERPGLEALARRVDAAGEWSHLAVSNETLAELTALAARCRQRERLGAFVGAAFGGLGPGVRALFKGPSGTGKTLAARLLAGALGMDLYRVDLAAVVNKYIGETEKNLERVFSRAEELDVVLLLDEGDALMTQRTGVQNANDRYANLETNYLLQRLESFEGILLVTTNAADRVDGGFMRRMDVVIDFALPDASERWSIWQLHLPDGHEVDLELLHAAVQRCALSGAQIRNAALHACLLAVESGLPVRSCHLEAAIDREYRKQGGMSPLRGRTGRP